MNTRLEAMILVNENQGADERPISIGDSTILFIRLTFADADDDFEWRNLSFRLQQQHVLNYRMSKLHQRTT